MKDKNILISWGIDLCPFDNIVLTAYVIDHNRWYTVNLVDTVMITELKKRHIRKTKLLGKINDTNNTLLNITKTHIFLDL